MTILPRESDLYPLDLFEREETGHEEGLNWWAIYTRSRHEKQLMRHLAAKKIAHYGPIVEHRYRARGGRSRTSWLPLFTNYVFVYGDGDSRYQVTTTNCVSRVMEVPDTERLTSELRDIRRLITAGVPVTTESKLEAGMRVRVKSGPFVGCEGVVIQRRGKSRLLVAVNFLQQGASVQLEDFELERI